MTKFIGRQKEFRENLLIRRKNSIILILDNFMSATNVASIFRIAYAYGVDRVYLVGSTPKPPFGKELSSIADNAEGKLDIRFSVSSKKLIAQYNNKGFVSVAVTLTPDTQSIDDLELNSDTIIVFTDQNNNLSKELGKACDYRVATTKFRKYTDAGIVNDLAVILYSIR